MASRVVSTKLNEDEHKRIMEICNIKQITVSKLLKKTLMASIREEKEKKHSANSVTNNQQSEQHYQKQTQSLGEQQTENKNRFMYY